MKALIRGGLWGLIIGMACGNLIALIFSALSGGHGMIAPELIGRMGSETTAFLVQTLLSGLQGAVAMAGVSFYDIENKHFGLLAASVCHLVLILVTYFPIAFFLNWIATFSEAILMTAIMTASYFIIFLIMYFRYKAEVKKLNELQKKQLNTCHGTAES